MAGTVLSSLSISPRCRPRNSPAPPICLRSTSLRRCITQTTARATVEEKGIRSRRRSGAIQGQSGSRIHVPPRFRSYRERPLKSRESTALVPVRGMYILESIIGPLRPSHQFKYILGIVNVNCLFDIPSPIGEALSPIDRQNSTPRTKYMNFYNTDDYSMTWGVGPSRHPSRSRHPTIQLYNLFVMGSPNIEYWLF